MSRLLPLLALALCGCNPARGVPIFLWHAVGKGCSGDVYDVPAEEFDRELSDIEAYGATPVTLEQLFDARDGHGTLPARPVILTFDDGRRCQLTEALPLLEKHKMVAETFVVTSFLGDDDAHRHVEHDAKGDHGFLTWPEVEAMEKSGRFVIESHGVTHERLSGALPEVQLAQLRDSKAQLAQRLGHPVDFFSYPFGSFTSQTRDLAEQAGYRAAMSVQKGWGTRFGLKRVSLGVGNERDLKRALQDAFGAPLHP
ncbi:MAG: polysaccharide deacetylase family protein [Deltaproteobacteria bacterium]|nr:polysaccharide deacetylase family protein [Deltaproteobacteria bacterium]